MKRTLLAALLLPLISQAQTTEFGNLNVVQNDSGNLTTSVTVTKGAGSSPNFAIRTGSNKADYNVTFGNTNDYDTGVLVATISENGRNNNAVGETIGTFYTTVGVDLDSATTPNRYYLALFRAPNAEEQNENVACAFFPCSQWLGGAARNAANTNGGATDTLAHTNFDAQRLVPIRIHQRGAVRTCGVRFRLGGVGVFTRAGLRPWTGRTPAPHEVFGATATDVEAALLSSPDADTSAHQLDAWLLGLLRLDDGRDVFEDALAAVVDAVGAGRVTDAAVTAGVSARQVERLFARHLGVAPKTVARVVRFQSALRALMRDPGCPLADVAVTAGYFDQAHFVREFRRMTGGVPRGYRGYYPPDGPHDFAPNVVAFVQDTRRRAG